MSNKNKCPIRDVNPRKLSANKPSNDTNNLLLFLNNHKHSYIKDNPNFNTILLESFFNILNHAINLSKNMLIYPLNKPQVTEKNLSQSKHLLQKEINDFLATLRSPKRIYDIAPITSFFIVHNHNNSYIKPMMKDTFKSIRCQSQSQEYLTPNRNETKHKEMKIQMQQQDSLVNTPSYKPNYEKQVMPIKVKEAHSRPHSTIKLVKYPTYQQTQIQQAQQTQQTQKDICNKDIIEKIKLKMKANQVLQSDIIENNGCGYIGNHSFGNQINHTTPIHNPNHNHKRNHSNLKPVFMSNTTPFRNKDYMKKSHSNCKTATGIPDNSECSFNYTNLDYNINDKVIWERSIKPSVLTSRLLDKYHSVLDVYNKTVIKKERNNSYDYNSRFKTEMN